MQCILWVEGISGESQEQPWGKGMSSRAQHMRDWDGEHLRQSLTCQCSLCQGTQGLKPGQMTASWPRFKAQQDQRIHLQGRWDACQHAHRAGTPQCLPGGTGAGCISAAKTLLLNIKGGTCRRDTLPCAPAPTKYWHSGQPCPGSTCPRFIWPGNA